MAKLVYGMGFTKKSAMFGCHNRIVSVSRVRLDQFSVDNEFNVKFLVMTGSEDETIEHS